jgi:hypothetical protein
MRAATTTRPLKGAPRMTFQSNLSRLAALSTLALAAACGGGGSGDANGRVTVLLTDAPATYKAAVVTITKISLMGDSGETVLSTKTTTTNLLTLANDAAKLVEDAVVKPGSYSELRFQLSGGYVEVPNAAGTGTEIYASSTTYEGLPAGAQVAGQLKMPSMGQSGLKVDWSGSIDVKAESKVLLVDFDVSQSFGHDAGNSGSWVMHPVIKGADLTVSGNVVTTLKTGAGVTLPPISSVATTLGQFNAVLRNTASTATDSTKRVAFAQIGSTATYGVTFKYLLPGSYTVDIEGPTGLTFATDPAHPLAVTVGQGVDANADFTVTSATSP